MPASTEASVTLRLMNSAVRLRLIACSRGLDGLREAVAGHAGGIEQTTKCPLTSSTAFPSSPPTSKGHIRLRTPWLIACRGARGHLLRGGLRRAGVGDHRDGADTVRFPASSSADVPVGPDRLPGRDWPWLGQRMTLRGLIAAPEDSSVAGTPDPDPVGAMGRSDLPDQSIARLVVQFLEVRGRDHKPPFRGRGLNAAWLLGRDQEHNLAHPSCFGSSRGFTLPGSTRIGVQPGIRGSVIERPPAWMAALPLAHAPQGRRIMAT